MQNILDDRSEVRKLDSKNMLASVELLGNQANDAWNAGKKMKISFSYKKVRGIVVAGMGGSTLGAHLLKSVFGKNIKCSFEIINDYSVPNYVGPETLVIASSYSGNTEETLAAAQDALRKKAKVIVIAAGGKLKEWAKAKKIPSLIFPTDNNPCGSPRMGLGYSVFGTAAILIRVGIIKISEKEFCVLMGRMAQVDKKFGMALPLAQNLAKQSASEIANRSVWFVGSAHLAGNAHVAANQMNENAKRFAGYFVIPEMNHHLLEGMLYPESNKNEMVFVLFHSKLYGKKIQNRFAITGEVLKKNHIKYLVYDCREKSVLAQAAEVLVFSGYLSYYSAILQGIDPTAIPFVDFFKQRLKK
jgi:glucose/mannose-6-phosphate isomerase